MRHTVIALFDDTDRAEEAAAALMSRGFDESAVHVTLNASEPGTEHVPPAAQIESGPLSGLLHRLALLFRVEEPHLSHYEEAVRRGGSVVQVDAANEAEAATARDALLAVGAANIDDRIEEWTRAGWRGAQSRSTTGPTGTVHRREVSIGGVRVYGHSTVVAFEELADEMRRDFRASEAGTGSTYEELEPAYRHGHALASDASSAGKSWDEVEPEARDRWERGQSQPPWERVRRAVRHAWEHATRR